MSWLDGLRVRLGQSILRRDAEDRLDEEIRFHLEMEIERGMAEGLSAEEARRRAYLRFGGVEKFREEVRDGWRIPAVSDWMRELRIAARSLTRTPAFTGVVVATLALGIGTTVAVFSLVDGVLLRRAPFAGVGELVVVWETDRATGNLREPASLPDFMDFQRESATLREMAALLPSAAILAGDQEGARRIPVVRATSEYLGMVGIEPVHGRGILADEDDPGAAPVALITERMWERDHARAPEVLGHSLEIDGRAHTIVGVIPDEAGFGLTQILAAADYAPLTVEPGELTHFEVWAPLTQDAEAMPRSTHPILVVGRLAEGVTLATAQGELGAVAAELEALYPNDNDARGVHLERLTDVIFDPVRTALLLLLGAVGVVLAIACVNVANLLLARGAARGREIALRRAIGAATGHLVRQFVAESALLALLATALGVALGWALLSGALGFAPGTISRITEVGLDGRALMVALAVSALVTFLFGLIPAAQALRIDIRTPLGDGTRAGPGRGGGTGWLLIAIEIGLAVVLVTASGLLIRSFWEVLATDTGFRTAGVVKADVSLPPNRYPVDFANWPNFAEIHRFYAAAEERIGQLPGVTGVALAGNHPLDRGFANSFVIVGREREASELPEIAIRRVTPDYYSILGTPLLEGRTIEPRDGTFAPKVALLNEAAATRFFPRTSAVGQQIRFWGETRTIVGVIGNEKFQGLTEADPIAVYTPLAQTPGTDGAVSVLALSEADPETIGDAIAGVIREIDAGVAVSGISTLEEALSRSLSERTFTTGLLGFFATISLLLAMLGVYSVVSHAMARRTREIGIRMALGETRPALIRDLVGHSLTPVMIGVAGGLVGALFLGGVLRSLLYGIAPGDPLTVAGTAVLILLTAVCASLIPAFRTTGVPPADVLRLE